MTGGDRAHWLRVQELFAAALELPAVDRAAFVRLECGADAALLRDVVELLDAEADAETWLSRLASRAGVPGLDGAVEEVSHTQAAPDFSEIVGTETLGAYRLIRPIARGGMGAVYLAERADGQFEKQVAVKLLPPGYGAPSSRARFLAERRILAGLEHPGIARLMDAGMTDSGAPWFVMEYVAGEAIDAWCDRRQVPVDTRLDLFLQVCDAVAYAHERRVVHRDLKPRNILVDERGRVKLLDFGIARAVDDELTRDTTLWAGTPLTPAYASPEQLDGGPAGPASDVYQLGVLLHVLLTGRPPFSLEGVGLAEMRRLVGEPPPDPALVVALDDDGLAMERATRRGTTPAALRAQLERGLADVVLRALRREPEERHASVVALADDVRRCRTAPDVTRDRGSTGATLARPRRRTGRAAFGAAMAVLAVLLMTAVFAVERRGAPSAPGDTVVAAFPFTVRGTADMHYLAAGAVTLLSANFDDVGEIRAADPHAVLVAADRVANNGVVAGGDAAQIAARLGARYYVTGEVVSTEGHVRISARLHGSRARSPPLRQFTVEGSPGDALRLIDGLSAQILEYLLPHDQVRIAARTTTSIPALRFFVAGERHYRAGRYRDAVAAFLQATSADSTFALAYHRLSMAIEWGGLGSAEPGLDPAAVAYRVRDRLPPREQLLVAAHYRYRLHDDVGAESTYLQLLRRFPDSVEGWYELGELYFHRRPAAGHGIAGARHAFERTLHFDPDHIHAIVHLARIAAVERDVEGLRDLVGRYLAHSAADESRSLEPRALLALTAGDVNALHEVNRALVTHDENRRWLTAVRAATYTSNIDGALAVLGTLLHHAPSPGMHALGLVSAGHMELARGRPGAARAYLPELRRLSPAAAATLRAQVALHPLIQADAAELAATARELAGVDRNRSPAVPFMLTDATWPVLAAWLDGRLALALGDSATARASSLALGRMAQEQAAGYARDLSARLAWAEGDAARALAILEEAGPLVGTPYVTGSPLAHPQHDVRLLRAELLGARGRVPESIGWFESIVEDYPFVIPHLPVSYLRRAELHDALGDDAAARENRRRFEALWQGDEPGDIAAK